MQNFNNYIASLQSCELSNITELSHRNSLHELLETIASEVNSQIRILHEPKRRESFGAPDFKIYNAKGIIGYVENKRIDENLDKVIKSEQITKYRQLSDNILITNYLEFVWLYKDSIQRETLCYFTDLENKKFKPNTEKVYSVGQLLRNFFSQAPIGIARADDLARTLALRSHFLRDFLLEELIFQEKDYSKRDRLWGLKDNLEQHVFNELTHKEFSDAYSQMLAYGLFLAKLNADTKEVSLRNIDEFIPSSFALIRELVEFLKILESGEHYKNVTWIIDEILNLINNLDLPAIIEHLTFKSSDKYLWKDDEEAKLLYAKDPYIYFYEEFLAAFDKELRKAKGVYYTPPPVVNFIIRALDDILKEDFGIAEGFADREKVTVLDFATGTGTFILEILQTIFDSLPTDSGKRDLIIREHILKNLFGFEYLIAPYTVAHLKLSQFLKDKGYEFQSGERLQIYLTNTLEPVKTQPNFSFPELTREGRNANAIKEKPILVITGNPPYYYASKNKGTWILNKIKDYYYIDGKKLKEKNPKGLQDDYVKFIRFAQWKMELVEEGAVGIITNHSFLDNPTFKGMRQSLMNTFDSMYFLDLHGNARKKEQSPDGGKDENIFDIEQGVAISILVKKKGLKKKIYHCDFYGSREDKNKLLYNNDLKSVKWKELIPDSEYYLFKWFDKKYNKRYKQGYNVNEIFNIKSTGITTARDEFAVSFEREELLNRLKKFMDFKVDAQYFKEKYKLKDTGTWNLFKARLSLSNTKDLEKYIKPFYYLPFDERYLFYHSIILDGPRHHLMSNFFNGNIGLICSRQVKDGFKHCFIVNKIHNRNLISTAGSLGNGYTFPLYIYDNIDDLYNGNNKENLNKIENFTTEFRIYINSRYKNRGKYIQDFIDTINPTPEDILGYIYAILHSNIFRTKYAEFLKIDFPRIPFTDNEEMFYRLSSLGTDLIEKHLLKDDLKIDEYKNLGVYKVLGDDVVVKTVYIEHSNEKEYGKLFINKKQYFDNVPKDVYEFYIGGYQVLDKYLSARKGRKLSIEEIENVEKIVRILAFTLNQMNCIDKLIEEWM